MKMVLRRKKKCGICRSNLNEFDKISHVRIYITQTIYYNNKLKYYNQKSTQKRAYSLWICGKCKDNIRKHSIKKVSG